MLSSLKKLLSRRSDSEKALFISEKRYQDFVTSSRDWIWECDKNGLSTYSNQAVLDILGYTPDELVGQYTIKFMHEQDRAEINKTLPDYIANKTGWHHKLARWQAKDGDWRFLESSGVFIFDENGNFSGFRGVDRDVTARIKAEKAYRESIQNLNMAFDALPEGVSINRLSDGMFIYANPALAQMSKYSLEQIIGNTVFSLNFYHDAIDKGDLMKKILKGKHITDYETTFQNKEGEIFPASLSCSLIYIEGNKCIITILRDISEQKAAESELRKLSTAMEQSHDAIFITNTDGIIEYVNSRMIDLTGFSKEELIGEKPNKWKSGETNSNVYKELWETISSGEIWSGEILNRKKNGECYWSSDIISPVLDKVGRISHFLGSQEDITEIRNLNQQLTWQANYDALTGLVNRREFERRLERIVANTIKKVDDKHALLFMDLDQFKVVNDTCGHTAGDELLRQLSHVLQEKVRKRDTLARIGGDEFAVLMEHCSIDHAYRLASSLLGTVQQFQFQWEQQVFRIGVSIGLIPITDKEFSSTELLKNADSACYIAKEQGRNRIHIYRLDDEDLVRRHGEMSWVTKLYEALEEDRFCLYAQSITSLKKGTDVQTTSYELLLRKLDKKGNIITPDQFFTAAERYNLATKLDQWVIKNIFKLLNEYPDFLENIEFICINLSGISLTDENILNYIVKQISENSEIINPQKLCFEVTETAAISHLSKASKFITTLKKLGCMFALDDFGSGLSSFAYLKNLPVDYLKIDGIFVKDIFDDPIDHAMVKSINEIGHVMKMKTIAEYVENDEIKGMLREIGVDYAQGYGISMPVPLDDLLRTHQTRRNNVIKLKPA